MGGEGTADAHWRESVFGNELMTGFVEASTNALSRVSVASMADLGYAVNLEAPIPSRSRRASGRSRRGDRGCS